MSDRAYRELLAMEPARCRTCGRRATASSDYLLCDLHEAIERLDESANPVLPDLEQRQPDYQPVDPAMPL